MPAIYIHKYYKLAFQISACVNGQKDVFYKTNEDSNFPEKESGARFLSQTIIRFNSGNFGIFYPDELYCNIKSWAKSALRFI